MKKILFVIAIFAGIQIAGAQVKTVPAAKSALENAKAASENEKKNTKFATWIKLAEAYIDAYDAPAGNGYPGMSKMERDIAIQEKPSSTESVQIGADTFTKEVYNTCNYYISINDVLSIIEITEPIDPDALGKAAEAYAKAYELDVKGAKKNDIANGLENIHKKLMDGAYNNYYLSKYKEASAMFEKSFRVSATEPCAKMDTICLYYAGETARMAGDFERARDLYIDLVKKYGYENDKGDAHANLASVYIQLGDKQSAKEILEQGFAEFPQGQNILVGLINLYIENKDDPERLFDLLDKAIANDSSNPSLYSVKGNIYSQLGKMEEAVAEYDRSTQIDPNYDRGYFFKGLAFFNKAEDIAKLAGEELDNEKYLALVKEWEASLIACAEPLEKAFEISNDPEVKLNVSILLKSASYRLMGDHEEFKAIYDKYSAYYDENKE